MSESCSGDCGSCGSTTCGEQKPASLLAEQNPHSNVKKVIAVVSGKGGVGKSTVTSMLATAVRKAGKSVAILDADVTGPSIPKAFGVIECRGAGEDGIEPAISEEGVQIMSINLLLDDESMPVLWRGPILAGTVKQFWSDVIWSDVDYMFVDMPPGTGDVPLTVYQSLPIDGIVIVSSPQSLVSMVVEKAVNMAKMMNVPVLGFVENYSYYECSDCGKKLEIFGKSHLDAMASAHEIPILSRLPIDPSVAQLCDRGDMDKADCPELAPTVATILAL